MLRASPEKDIRSICSILVGACSATQDINVLAVVGAGHADKNQIAVMLKTLYSRLPDLETTGPAVKMRAVSSNGIKHLPVAWTPTA